MNDNSLSFSNGQKYPTIRTNDPIACNHINA